MDVLMDLKRQHAVPWDDQGRGPAGSSQLRRWLLNSSVLINGTRMQPDDVVLHLKSVVFFPGRPRQTSVF